MNKEWLYYFLSRDEFRAEGAERMSGAVGHKRVAKEFIEACAIPVPTLPEQKRIVGILDEAFEGIATAKASAEKNLANAHELFNSDLNSVVTEMWESCELVSLSELATDITDGDHLPPPKALTGVPFITIGNIEKQTRTIEFSIRTWCRKIFNRLKANRKTKKDDILYTVTGSFGIPVVVEDDFKFCFQRHIGLICPKAETRSAWLYYLLLSRQVHKQANEGATGTAQKTVSLKVRRRTKVPRVPPPLQQSAVTKFDALAAETKRLRFLSTSKSWQRWRH